MSLSQDYGAQVIGETSTDGTRLQTVMARVEWVVCRACQSMAIRCSYQPVRHTALPDQEVPALLCAEAPSIAERPAVPPRPAAISGPAERVVRAAARRLPRCRSDCCVRTPSGSVHRRTGWTDRGLVRQADNWPRTAS